MYQVKWHANAHAKVVNACKGLAWRDIQCGITTSLHGRLCLFVISIFIKNPRVTATLIYFFGLEHNKRMFEDNNNCDQLGKEFKVETVSVSFHTKQRHCFGASACLWDKHELTCSLPCKMTTCLLLCVCVYLRTRALGLAENANAKLVSPSNGGGKWSSSTTESSQTGRQSQRQNWQISGCCLTQQFNGGERRQ